MKRDFSKLESIMSIFILKKFRKSTNGTPKNLNGYKNAKFSSEYKTNGKSAEIFTNKKLDSKN